MNRQTYKVYLTEEELKAIPIILNMAMIYSLDLYDKKEEDKYYDKHKENIDMINEYHSQGYQGVLAVGSFIESKAMGVLKNKELNEILQPYMNKPKIEDRIIYRNKEVEIKNHIGEFTDDYIDSIMIIYDKDKTYDTIPIENKFTIPYIKDGVVRVCYKSLCKNCMVYCSSNF